MTDFPIPGFDYERLMAIARDLGLPFDGVGLPYRDDEMPTIWDPLASDTDSLALVLHYGIAIIFKDDQFGVCSWLGEEAAVWYAKNNPESLKELRRAVVGAAFTQILERQ